MIFEALYRKNVIKFFHQPNFSSQAILVFIKHQLPELKLIRLNLSLNDTEVIPFELNSTTKKYLLPLFYEVSKQKR